MNTRGANIVISDFRNGFSDFKLGQNRFHPFFELHLFECYLLLLTVRKLASFYAWEMGITPMSSGKMSLKSLTINNYNLNISNK